MWCFAAASSLRKAFIQLVQQHAAQLHPVSKTV
jgi:hypothetical protein